jgi:hypothetical protein
MHSNYVCVFDEADDCLGVDRFAFHHGVGDAGQLNDFPILAQPSGRRFAGCGTRRRSTL